MELGRVMKIRNGFVSNSSSSSFCLFGVYLDDDDLDKVLEITPEIRNKLDSDDYDTFDYITDKMDKIFVHSGLSIEYIWEDHSAFIGGDPTEIGDDETGRQFKDRVTATLRKFNISEKPSWQEGVIYN
jgi:hypothetical protein